MLDFKKRLQSFMPGEATKAKLQDVLTVEWSGYKTVLVEVPTQNPKSIDVEMSGMSSPTSGAGGEYGRLLDEDDEDDYSRRPMNRSRYSDQGSSDPRERERQRASSLQDTQQHQQTAARPHNPNFTKYHSYSESTRARDPFAEPAELDERHERREHTPEGKFGEWAGPSFKPSKQQAENPFR